MPEEICVYGQYSILQLMVDVSGYKAGIAVKPEERDDIAHRYFINVYEDPVVCARVKKMLPWITSPDYVENFECRQAFVLVFRHTDGTVLDECLKTCESMAQRFELIKKSVVFIANQLEHFPVAMLSCLINPSLIMYDGKKMRFRHLVQFKGEYPYDVQQLMPHIGNFISSCLPSVCMQDKRVKQFMQRCEKKAFKEISGIVSDSIEIITALSKKYGHKDNFNIFNKYSDILQGYAPAKKKRKSAALFIVVILMLIAICFAYIYFFPDRNFVIWNNSDILKAIKALLPG